MGGDGQVTHGKTIIKASAVKVRRMYQGRVLAGFAGGASDALTLFERFEQQLSGHKGNLTRAAVELAKEWRADRVLRRLQAVLAVADRESSLLISGSGDCMEPDDGIIAIGSGGAYARAAAKALMKHSKLNVEELVREALEITASICVYTNRNITVESL